MEKIQVKKTKELPENLWVAAITPDGVWSKYPVSVFRDSRLYNGKPRWLGADEDDPIVYKIGLDEDTRGYTVFSSEDRAQVELWLSGVLSVMRMLRDWSE